MDVSNKRSMKRSAKAGRRNEEMLKRNKPLHKCWYCHGTGVIERDGKATRCPECGGFGGYYGEV